MTDKQQPAPNSVKSDPEAAIEILDLGDAAVETKQQSAAFLYPDCIYAWGSKYGCG